MIDEKIDAVNTFESVLKKINLSEEEANILFSHLIKSYVNEKCSLTIGVDGNTEYEGDSKYSNITVRVGLELEGEEILYNEDYCSFNVG